MGVRVCACLCGPLSMIFMYKYFFVSGFLVVVVEKYSEDQVFCY